jgi:hypothetical protein
MPKTKRDNLKRLLAQAYHNADRSLLCIIELHNIFNPVHPDMAEGLEIATQLIIQAQQIMEQFSLSAWETDKESLLTYRE